jgi:hypothetical protein
MRFSVFKRKAQRDPINAPAFFAAASFHLVFAGFSENIP